MADRIDGIDDEQPGGRVRRLVEMFRRAQDDEPRKADKPQTDFQKAANALKDAAKLKGSGWGRDRVSSVMKLVMKALARAAKDARVADVRNEYAIEQAVEMTRDRLAMMMEKINPPSELAESEDFLELLELLKPPAQQREQSSFHKGSALKGDVKKDVLRQQVAQAVKDASKLAGKKLEVRTQNNANLSQFSQMSLDQMARMIQRMRRKKTKKKGEVDENGEIVETSDVDEAAEAEETRQLQAMMEMFSAKALETMRSIRDDIAPKWAPEQQPWLIAEADRMVYDILLATVPEDLLAETQIWQEIQDLREGQAVFTLRAANKLTEAASRNKG